MIDPNLITTVKTGNLPEETVSLTDNIAHEVSGELKLATVQELADTIGNYLGSINGIAFRAVTVLDGQTLPITTINEWILVGSGTFQNVGGGSSITTTEELNALISNGFTWSLGVEIPITVELSNLITQNIRSGYTTTSPSENAVFNYIDLIKNNFELISNKVTTLTDSYADYPSSKAVKDALDLKADVIDDLNQFITKTGFSLASNIVTINADNIWKLSGTTYTNTSAINTTIPYSTAGKQRIVYVVPNTTNGFNLVSGTESVSNPIAPTITNPDMYVTFLLVTDGTVATQVVPDYSSLYAKRYKTTYEVPTSQIYYNIGDGEDDYNVLFNNTVTSYITIHLNGHNGRYIKNGATYPFKSIGTGDVVVNIDSGVTLNAPNGTTLNKNQQCYLIKDNTNSWTLVNPIVDSNVVHKTGNENIGGIKTFSDGNLVIDGDVSQLFLNSNNPSGKNWKYTSRNDGYFLIGRDGIGNDLYFDDLGNANFSKELTVPNATLSGSAVNKSQLDLKANKDNAALTGVPTAPTATAGTNTTQIATTEFVKANTDATAHWTKTGNDIRNNNTGKIELKPGTKVSILNSANAEKASINSNGDVQAINFIAAPTTGSGLSGMYSVDSGQFLRFDSWNGNAGYPAFNFNLTYPSNTSIIGEEVVGIYSGYTIAPTSGNGKVSMLKLAPTINQTGGANGITRGIYINPTLTSTTDFRAIEVTDGKVIIPNGVASNEAVNKGQLDTAIAGGNNVIRLKNYTVSTLPTGVQGDTAYVTDALAPTYLTTVVGGGSVVCPVFFDGVSWKAH